MALTLVIGNKSYSSWSMRPWILLESLGVPYAEVVQPIHAQGSREAILKVSPSGKVPALVDGDITVWDSLAICEYLAESFPQLAVWPREKAARAMARSMSAEMHSSFQALRQNCPTIAHRPKAAPDFTPDTLADIARIEAMWGDAREKFGAGGAFLFGAFSAADAMFAPIVWRFENYCAPVNGRTRAYMDATMAMPAWKKWMKGAAAESWRIPRFEPQPA
ncbi:MAG: glutathione S-transferase family protein [Rhodoblastus sp.]